MKETRIMNLIRDIREKIHANIDQSECIRYGLEKIQWDDSPVDDPNGRIENNIKVEMKKEPCSIVEYLESLNEHLASANERQNKNVRHINSIV